MYSNTVFYTVDGLTYPTARDPDKWESWDKSGMDLLSFMERPEIMSRWHEGGRFRPKSDKRTL